jgi:hypothetical protein
MAPVTTTSAMVATEPSALPPRSPEITPRQVPPDANPNPNPPKPPSGYPPIGNPNAAPVISRMESFYAQSMPFEADVAIETMRKSHNVRQQEQGRLLFDKRGRVRVTFANGDIVLADGGTFTYFQKASGTLFQQAVAQDHCPAAFAFATAPGTMASRMGVMRFDGIGLNAPGLDVLVGTPNTAQQSLSKLLVYVRPSGEVPRVLFMPPNGDRVRFDFSNLSANVKPPLALAVPSGTLLPPQPPPAPNQPLQPQGPFLTTL